MGLSRITKLIFGSAIAMLIAFSPLNASALQNGAASKAKFSPTEAADCAAVYGWILQFMAPSGMPEKQVTQTHLAFMMWGYELNASLPGASEADMQKTAAAAVTRLDDEMPLAKTEQEVEQLLEAMIDKADFCGAKLAAEYEGVKHPVITALENQNKKARASQKNNQPSRGLRE